jgi:cell wall-associated NlpC family hydrolase
MSLDPRLHAYRPDLADARLKGQVTSSRFVEGVERRVIAPSAPIKATPSFDEPLASEALRSEVVTVFDDAGGWSWGQLQTDGYVGYFPTVALAANALAPTHRIAALRAHIYPGPDMKLPPVGALSFGAMLTLSGEATTRGTAYRLLPNNEGAIVAAQAEPLDAPRANDFVAVAERFLNAAYLWGGRTSIGLDCSALVQLALAAAGTKAPRDTDQQERALGVATGDAPRRGDLVFWKGHVAIMIDNENALHATGHAMAVVIEPLAAIITRAGQPASVRRLD